MLDKQTSPNWKEVVLRDICESYRYGYTASARENPIGPKFLRITDIVPDLLDWEAVPYCRINEDDVEKYILEDGDIVIARTGATTGYAKQVKNPPFAVFASYLVRLRLKSKINKYFVGHLIESKVYKEFVKQNIGGAAQPNANAQVLTSFSFNLPPLPIQRKIAAVLSAYDDLIENNTRRIEILEEMARAIYREWFVEFRFPGHEDVEMVDSGLGPIPEGWDVVQFSELAHTKHNRIQPDKHEQEKYSYYSFSAYDEKRLPEQEYGQNIGSSKYIVHAGSVLLSKLNPRIPRVWLPFPTSVNRNIASTEFLVLLPNSESGITREYLYSLCNSQAFHSRFEALTGGTSTSHQRVKQKSLLGMNVIKPSIQLISKFDDQVKSIYRLVYKLRLKNQNLRETRDLLLPKLVSGEVDVSEIEIDNLEKKA